MCSAKGTTVSKFISSATSTIKAHELWSNCEEEELKMAVTQIQRTTMGILYDSAFTSSKDDFELAREIAGTIQLELDDFEIPQKYHSEAPWPFAQLGRKF
jgi:hypothetical protein